MNELIYILNELKEERNYQDSVNGDSDMADSIHFGLTKAINIVKNRIDELNKKLEKEVKIND